MRRRELVQPLEKRAEYLRERIGSGELSAGALGWNAAELKALDYALAVLRDMIERDSDLAVDVPRQREQEAWRLTAGKALLALSDLDPVTAGRIMAKGPEGIEAVVERLAEQRRYGRVVPSADDTRRRRFA